MFRTGIVIILLVLATLACSFSTNIGIENVDTGPTVVEEINIQAPDSDGAPTFSLDIGFGEVSIRPGDQSAMVAGTVTYNVDRYHPRVLTEGSSAILRQGDEDDFGGGGDITIPNFRNDNVIYEFDLTLGSMPMQLDINAGATDSDIDLGGLSIERLTMSQGAGEINAVFSELNQSDMSSLVINAGAGELTLEGLANANAESMRFSGGAGEYWLSFDGDLQRDLDATVDAGVGQLTIIIPDGTSAVVEFDGGVSNVNTSGSWSHSGDTYTLEGSGPTITLRVSMGVGEFNLRTQ
ncbi:MAG: toast rack family protein [Anaerolineales bacterium]|jgi:hypothetical protein